MKSGLQTTTLDGQLPFFAGRVAIRRKLPGMAGPQARRSPPAAVACWAWRTGTERPVWRLSVNLPQNLKLLDAQRQGER